MAIRDYVTIPANFMLTPEAQAKEMNGARNQVTKSALDQSVSSQLLRF